MNKFKLSSNSKNTAKLLALVGAVALVAIGSAAVALSRRVEESLSGTPHPTVSPSSSLFEPTASASATASPAASPSAASSPSASPSSGPQANQLLWMQTDSGWKAANGVPQCASILGLKSPVDLSKATSILYPGQSRGGNYKPHGGFRFDTSKNADITVKAPTEGFLVRGGRYLAKGEIQYTFDVINNCGVMYRVGHLREVPAAFQKIADSWPEPQEGDSRTSSVNPPVFVAEGEVLGTSVGIVKDGNAFLDWGVYDYRKQNEASASAAYQQAHAQDKELSWHAVCWFDWLSESEEAKVRSLPAGDQVSGKKSDYCT